MDPIAASVTGPIAESVTGPVTGVVDEVVGLLGAGRLRARPGAGPLPVVPRRERSAP